MPIPVKRVQTFAEGLDHPECVATHPDGTIWAGGELGQIYRISKDGKTVDEVARTGGFVLGIAFSPDASWLVACDLKKNCLWRLDVASGKLSEFASGKNKPNFSIPNFPVFADDGTLYVSDSGGFGKVTGTVLRYDADHSGRGEIWHRGPFSFANGMALTPKRDALMVTASWLPGVERIEIRPDGSAGKRSVYARLPKTVPDGLAFEARGNLYVTCYAPSRIYKVTPKRKVSILVDDWEAHSLSNPTNIAFGGTNYSDLYASNLGRWHIARIELGVKGSPLACFVRSGKN